MSIYSSLYPSNRPFSFHIGLPFLIVFILLFQGVFAQLVPTIRTPKAEYLVPGQCDVRVVSDREREPTKNDGTWIVWADRNNDTVYTDRNLQTVKKERVVFLEPFYVVDETNTAVKLLKFDQNIVKKEKNKVYFERKDATEVGWMPKNKLLLWQSSLSDKATGFLKKAVPVEKRVKNKSDSQAVVDRLRKGKGVCDFYKSPYVAGIDTTKDVNFFTYLFVFKEEGTRLLLSKSNEVLPGNIESHIYGWVPKSQVFEWNSAVCLRINYNQEAVEQRNKMHLPVKFFNEPDEAQKYATKDSKGNIIREGGIELEFTRPGGKREYESAFHMGMPILMSQKEMEEAKGVVKTGYITNLKDGQGRNILDYMTQAEYDSLASVAQKNINNMTVVFVLDGALRKSHFENIARSIENNQLIDDKQYSNINIKWGYVIYNASGCGSEFETIEPINDKNRFVQYLRDAATKQPACDLNRSGGAPLLSALKKVPGLFKNDVANNNLFVFGTTGDPDQSISMESLAEKFNQKNINMRVFQIWNEGGSSSDRFISQCKDLMIYAVEKKDESLRRSYPAVYGSAKAKLVCKSGECVLKNGPYVGKITYGFQHYKLPSYLSDYFRDKLNFDEYTKTFIGGGRFIQGENEDVELKKAAIRYFEGDKKLPDFVKGGLGNDRMQLFYEAYTRLTATGVLKQAFVIRTLFMSSDEFRELKDMVDDLSRLTDDDASSREQLCNTFISIHKNYIGGNVKGQSLNRILEQSTGVPSNNNALKVYPEDLKNPNKVSQECIKELINNFKQWQKDLERVERNEGGLYKYDRHEEVYYWVPESYITMKVNCAKRK